MSSWVIYSKDGEPKHWYKAVTDDDGNIVRQDTLEMHDEWMGENFLSVSIKNSEPIDFAVGDYIMYRGEKYTIEYDPTVLKKAKSGSYGEGFNYDNIKFVNEAQAKIVRCDFTDVVLNPNSESNKQHYTWLPTFPFYCETVEDLLDRIQANLEELYAGQFVIVGPSRERAVERGEVVGRANDFAAAYDKWIGGGGASGKHGVAMTVDNITCWDALTKAHDEFDLNFIVRGYTVLVGTAGVFTSSKFRYGKGNGLYEIERIGDSEQQIVTLLRAYGSENNLPVNYYANLHKKAFVTISGKVVQDSQIAGDNTKYRSLKTSVTWSTVKNSFITKVDGSDDSWTVTLQYGDKSILTAASPVWDETVQTQMLWFQLGSNESYVDFFDSVPVGGQIIFTTGVDITRWPKDMTKLDPGYENLPQALVVNRLMLPGFPDQDLYHWALAHGWTSVDQSKGEVTKGGVTVRLSTNALRPYIMSLNADEYGIRPGSIYFDGTNDTEEICPTIKGTGKDKVVSATQIADSGVYPEGKAPDPFHITLPNLGFDLAEYYESGAAIDMTSGMCGGRSFEMKSQPKQNKQDGTWDCEVNRREDTTLHLWYPYSDFQIRKDDQYVLTGIRMPNAYVELAAERLFDAAIEALAKNDAPRFTYQPRIDEIWMQREHDAAQDGESLHDTLKAGDIFQFEDADIFGVDGEGKAKGAQIIIDVLTIKENGNNGIPTYEVTLRDEKQVSTIQKIQNKVDSLSNGGNGGYYGNGGGGGAGSSYTSAQIESLIESAGKDIFLSKTTDDEAAGMIGFLKGLWVKAKGLFGIDGNGNAQLNNIEASGDLDVKGDADVKGNLDVGGIFDAIEAKIDQMHSHNYSGSGLGDTGWNLTNNDGTGASLLEVDKLLVRMKATFMELEIRKETFSGGNVHYSPAGSIVYRVDYLDADGHQMGVTEVKVPWLLKGLAFLLQVYSYAARRKIRRQLTPEEMQQVARYRLYMIADDGTTATRNWWQVGDQVRCQTFNKATSVSNKRGHTYDTDQSGVEDPASPLTTNYYWRLVTAVGSSVLDDGRVYDWIELPNEKNPIYAEEAGSVAAIGSDIPAAGDTIVCMGNRYNPARMNMVSIISVATDEWDAPSVKGYRGIHTFSLEGCLIWSLSPRGLGVRDKDFYYIMNDGTEIPNILERGDWVLGVRYHWYDRVSHNGSLWLCMMVDQKIWVDTAGNKLAVGATPPSPAKIMEGEGNYDYTVTIGGKSYTGSDHYYKYATVNDQVAYYQVQDWTYDEPVDGNDLWLKQVSKGTEITRVIVAYAASKSGIVHPADDVSGNWKSVGLGERNPDTADAAISATGINDAHHTYGIYLWTRRSVYYSDRIDPVREYSVVRWGIDADGIHDQNTYFLGRADGGTINSTNDNFPMPGSSAWAAAAVNAKWFDTFDALVNAVTGGLGAMQGWFIWTKTVIKYDQHFNADGTEDTKPDLVSYQCNRIGQDGQIAEEEYYMLATSDDFSVVFGNPAQAASYYYNKSGIRWYTEDTPSATDIPSAENWRLSSVSPNINPQIWSTSKPVYDDTAAKAGKKYLWNFEYRTDGMGTPYATRPICIGDYSRGIKGVKGLYALSQYGVPDQQGRLYPSDVRSGTAQEQKTLKNVWTDEVYDRAPIESLPYQWNWTRTLYSTPKDASDTAKDESGWWYEDFYHVSAVRGTNGEDGAGKESIYKLTNTADTPATPANPQDRTIDDYVPSGWSDNPTGISFQNQYEWVSVRKLGAADAQGRKQWGDFSTPKLRSHWGKNGMDGDGVEYVFIRTKTNVAPVILAPSGTGYKSMEWLPYVNGSGRTDIEVNTGTQAQPRCTDDAQDVTETWPYEWVAIRKMDSPNAETGHRDWKSYYDCTESNSHKMSLWHNFAENSIRIDLTNQAGLVSLDSEGKVRFDITVVAKARILDGGHIATSNVTNSTTDSLVIGGCTPTTNFSNGELTVTWVFTKGMAASATAKTFKLTYKGTTYEATFTLGTTNADAIWQVMPNPSEVSFSLNSTTNTLTPSSIQLYCGYTKATGSGTISVAQAQVNSSGQILISNAGTGMYLYYRVKGSNGNWGNWTAYTAALTVNSTDTNTDYELCITEGAMNNAQSNIIDREAVPVVKDGKNGKDGAFKSRVFCRTNNTPNTPSSTSTGGYNTYTNPIPPAGTDDKGQAVAWTDGIPAGTAKIWSSVCTFNADGTNSGWSTPAPESDTADLDIEFSPDQTEPPVSSLRTTPGGAHPVSQYHWYDPTELPSGQTMIWRAERKIKNGVYDGEWVITRIYGEKGDAAVFYEIDLSGSVFAHDPNTGKLIVDIKGKVYKSVGNNRSLYRDLDRGMLYLYFVDEDGQEDYIDTDYTVSSGTFATTHYNGADYRDQILFVAEIPSVGASASIQINKYGANGDDGNDAVDYSLECTPEAVNFRSDATGTFSGYVDISCAIWKHKGNVSSAISSGTDGLYLYGRKNNSNTWVAYNGAIRVRAQEDAIDANVTAVPFVLSRSSSPTYVDSSIVKRKDVPIICDGRRGSVGAMGKMFYSMGDYDASTTYERTDELVPMVFYDNGVWNEALGVTGNYYYLALDTNVYSGTHYAPGQKVTIDGEQKDVWKEANSFGVVITQGLFAEFAKLGKAIMSGDYMFSMNGYIGDTEYVAGAKFKNLPAYTMFAGDPNTYTFAINNITKEGINTKPVALHDAITFEEGKLVVLKVDITTVSKLTQLSLWKETGTASEALQYTTDASSVWTDVAAGGSFNVSTTMRGKTYYIRFTPSSTSGYLLKARVTSGTGSFGINLSRFLFEPNWWVDLLTGKMVAARGNFVSYPNGDLDVKGTIRATNLYKSFAAASTQRQGYSLVPFATVLGTDGETQVWIYFRTSVTIGGKLFGKGTYHTKTEVEDAESVDTTDWTGWVNNRDICIICTYNADEVLVTYNSGSTPTNSVVYLPKCSDFPGKLVTLRNYINEYEAHVYQVNYLDRYDDPSVVDNPFIKGFSMNGFNVNDIIDGGAHDEDHIEVLAKGMVSFYSTGRKWLALQDKASSIPEES